MEIGIYLAALALLFSVALFTAIKLIERNNHSNKVGTALVIGALLAGANYGSVYYVWFVLIPIGYVFISHYDLGLISTVGLLIGLGFLATFSQEIIEVSFDWLATQGIEIPRVDAGS